ncbi:DUF2057 family protein [Kaarinaea lacus]
MYMKYRTTRIFAFLLVCLFIAIILTACQGKGVYQAYEGEPKPSTEIATIKIPVEMRLLYVDDQPNKGSWLIDTTTIQALPGQHRFIFYYEIFWELSSSDAEKVKSQPFALNFNTTAGDTFVIELPPIETLEAAIAFAKNPQFTIINQSTKEPVAFEQTTRIKDKGYVAAFVESVTKEKQAETPASEATQSKEALDKLKYWWDNADTNQRQDFMQWVYKQKSAVTTETSTTPDVTGQEPAGEALEKLKHWWNNADANQRQDFMQWVYKQ